MGVCAVVIARNRNGISLPDFQKQLERDEWGRFAATRVGHLFGWEEFSWNGESYFSWQHGPRFQYLGFIDANEGVSAGDFDCPNQRNAFQLSFLKAMLAVERIAGGPVFLGVDTVLFPTPEVANAFDVEFSLPSELDAWMPNWREVGPMKVANPGVVF